MSKDVGTLSTWPRRFRSSWKKSSCQLTWPVSHAWNLPTPFRDVILQLEDAGEVRFETDRVFFKLKKWSAGVRVKSSALARWNLVWAIIPWSMETCSKRSSLCSWWTPKLLMRTKRKKGRKPKPRNRDQISKILVPTSSVRKSNRAVSSSLAGVQGDWLFGIFKFSHPTKEFVRRQFS